MPQTVILVDLENVQLQVDDLRGLIRGQHQLRIFHGPSQNKLTMDLVRALQPLGDAVAYIQCEKAGPNALDFHLAFHLGRLSALQPDDAYVIVSRDKGFAQLVSHGNKLGHHIRQVDRLVIDGQTSPSRATAAKPTAAGKAERAAPTKKAPATKLAVKKTAPAKKAAAAKKSAPVKTEAPQASATRSADPKAPAKKARNAQNAPATRKAATPKPTPAPAPAAKKTASSASSLRSTPSASDISKALASLKRMAPEKRPTKAASLEHHLQSHLRADLSEAGVAAVVEALFAQGWIERAAGHKVSYALERR